MQTNDVIASIGRMAPAFYPPPKVSMLTLLKECGYFDRSRDVTIDALQAHFAAHSDDLDAWVLNSYDNRSSPAWYVAQPGGPGDKWVVGHQPGAQRDYF